MATPFANSESLTLLSRVAQQCNAMLASCMGDTTCWREVVSKGESTRWRTRPCVTPMVSDAPRLASDGDGEDGALVTAARLQLSTLVKQDEGRRR